MFLARASDQEEEEEGHERAKEKVGGVYVN
jgi:hypothetical protein